MMTSQSEPNFEANPMPMPPPLLREETEKSSEVARLEFATLELRGQSVVVSEDAEVMAETTDSRAEENDVVVEQKARSERQHAVAEIEAAYKQGLLDGRDGVLAETEQKIEIVRAVLLKACANFKIDREGYFAAVEAEVVNLALAIAARVLHREATLDPMLLRGVVKVALGRVMDESGTMLRVPMLDVSAWQEVVRQDSTLQLEISGDAKLRAGECILETRVGRVELGVAAQLEEIEKGFFDLLQQRPS
jgi:flagellar assembly protein FliH